MSEGLCAHLSAALTFVGWPFAEAGSSQIGGVNLRGS